MKSTRLLPLLLLLTACQRAAAPAAPPAPSVPSASDTAGPTTSEPADPPAVPAPEAQLASVADAWLGKWAGPEGSALEIAPDGAGYALKITSLDGPVDYYGIATPDGISFERNGAMEAVRAGNGDDTGMKWLAGKANCLVIRPGEGYCRVRD